MLTVQASHAWEGCCPCGRVLLQLGLTCQVETHYLRGEGGVQSSGHKAERQHAVSWKGSGQVGFSQSWDPGNHMGRPGQVLGTAGHRLRSLRDCVVSSRGGRAGVPADQMRKVSQRGRPAGFSFCISAFLTIWSVYTFKEWNLSSLSVSVFR